jgi:hypothetical protein
MRNMSFALTTAQILDGTKTVTRRLGWLHLKPGDQIRPVKKCMGLRPGETVQVLRSPLRVERVTREPLRAMTENLRYGQSECAREGFPDMTPDEFVKMFCHTHKGCTPETEITRIRFAYERHQTEMMPNVPVSGDPLAGRPHLSAGLGVKTKE